MKTGANRDALGAFVTSPLGEPYLHAVNRDSFTRSGSEAVFRKFFGTSLWQEESLHIIIGTDSGLLPAYIRKQGPARGSRYLFVELPGVIASLRQAGLQDETDPQIQILTTDHWLATAENNNLMDYLFLNQAYVHQSLAASDAYLPDYTTLSMQIQDEFMRYSWQALQGQTCHEFFDKILLNVAENRIPLNGIFANKPFQGYTAVLAAGGPSLDAMIPWIHQHREQIVLFAVSRICRRLHEVGLAPDIIVSIDPTHMSFEISKEMFHFADHSLFITGNHVSEEILGQWPGRAVYLGNRFPWDTGKNNTPVCGPSVTNSALMAAIYMGFEQILFAGVDLCFTPEGHSHAQGSDERDCGARLGHIGTQVETNSGRLAETEYPFAQAIDSLASQAAYAKQQGCTCINSNPDAARIKDVVFKPVGELRLTPLPEPATTMLARLLPVETPADRIEDYREARREVERLRYRLDKIQELARQGLDHHQRLFDPQTVNKKTLQRLNKIEQRLDEEFGNESLFVKKYGLRHFSRLVKPDDEMEWSEAETDATGRGYYQAYIDSTDEIMRVLDSVDRRLQCRLNEERDEPDFEQLEQQWLHDGQPGRVAILKEHSPHSYARLYNQHPAAIDQLLADFTAMLTADNQEHLTRSRKDARLEPVRQKALLLFQQQKREDLHGILRGLEADTREEAGFYQALVRAYLAELDGREADALAAYQTITSGPLLEDALKRIAMLTLEHQDLDNAALALDCLSAISPMYLPQYADVKRLQGDFARAAELYTLYLDQAQEDLVIAIRLGRLYQEHGINDIAAQIFDYVLQKDPDNRAAQQLRHQLEIPA